MQHQHAASHSLLTQSPAAATRAHRMRSAQLTVPRAEAFYAEHRERPFFPGLVEFMTSGPVVAAVLAKPGAVTAWRALIGPTNSLDARVKAPKRWGVECRLSQPCRLRRSMHKPQARPCMLCTHTEGQ